VKNWQKHLKQEGLRVWFDQWEMQAGDHLSMRLNGGMEKSRKIVAVWSDNYFSDEKVWTRAETLSQIHSDPLSKGRPLIPILYRNCKRPPTLREILFIDFQKVENYESSFRQLLESISDIPFLIRSAQRLEQNEAYDATPIKHVRKVHVCFNVALI
jgi:hypothetical protein